MRWCWLLVVGVACGRKATPAADAIDAAAPTPADAACDARDATDATPDASYPAIDAAQLFVDAAAVPDAPCDAPRMATDAAVDATLDAPPSLTYDQLVVADHPTAYLPLAPGSGSGSGTITPDLTGHGHSGTLVGSAAAMAALPNGDLATSLQGSGYFTIPSDPVFSISTTGNLTWEAWIRPDALELAHANAYVNWMGKCQDYAPSCEWEARLYDATTLPDRCGRYSAYAFNPSAGLGAGADWQPACGDAAFADGRWHHVVGEYATSPIAQPDTCPASATAPGAVSIWVDGIAWDAPLHSPTGCLSQFDVVPAAGSSPVNIGASALDTLFVGAVGKVAFYDYPLSGAQIAAHYQAMMGRAPAGSCATTCAED